VADCWSGNSLSYISLCSSLNDLIGDPFNYFDVDTHTSLAGMLATGTQPFELQSAHRTVKYVCQCRGSYEYLCCYMCFHVNDVPCTEFLGLSSQAEV
jgi:hypothetical protein